MAWCLSLPATSLAATTVHVKYPVYGCEKQPAVAVINNEADPRHTDPEWLATTMGYGQCVRITPQSPWEPLSADQGGLTLLAYRGAVGRPGSFFVPTAAIDFAPGTGGPPGPADQPLSIGQAAGTGSQDTPMQAAPSVQANPDASTRPPSTLPPSALQTPAAGPPPPATAPSVPAGDSQLAEVEAGVARIEPSESSGSLPVVAAIAVLTACGGLWLAWRRRRSLKRARLLDAIRLEVAANAQALRAKRAQTVVTDEYGTADWSQWNAAKIYYVTTRIDPIVAEHGFRQIPAGLDGDVDGLIERASAPA